MGRNLEIKEDLDMVIVDSSAIENDMTGNMVKVEVDFGIINSKGSVMIRAPQGVNNSKI
jgi:hypothetical protein